MTSVRVKTAAILAAIFALVMAPLAANAYTPTAPNGGTMYVEPGTTTNAEFTGFEPGESVEVTITDPDGNTTTQTMTADSDGNLDVPVTVPADAQDGDVYQVDATGATSGSAHLDAIVTVPDGPVGGEIWTTPGKTKTVTFKNFVPNETVSLVLSGRDGADATLAAIKTANTSVTSSKKAKANGDLSVTVTVPGTAKDGDTYTLTGTGQNGSADFLIHISESAGDGPSGSGDIEGTPGQTVDAEFDGFQPGEEVTVTVTDKDGNVVYGPKTVTADKDGKVKVTYTIPSDAKNGDVFTIKAVGEVSGEATTRIVVKIDGKLPSSGSDISTGVLAAGGALLVAGGLLILVARRRKQQES